MEITCKNCQKKLNIPDEKIPKADAFAITCPQCSEKFTVNLKEASSEESATQPQITEEEKSLSETSQLDFDEDMQSALICEDNADVGNTVAKVLKSLKYRADMVMSLDEAFDKLRFNSYDIVVLNELFDESTPQYNEILEHFQLMQISARRHILIVLLGSKFTTMDNMQAFEKSVNLVLNLKDLSKLTGVLKKALKENRLFYRNFKEILRDKGRG